MGKLTRRYELLATLGGRKVEISLFKTAGFHYPELEGKNIGRYFIQFRVAAATS